MTTSREALVGRDEELAFLRDRLGRARSGAGRLVLVCGPAGIGKTRLVEELVADGTEVAWGAAVDDPGMPALWPWTRALRGLPNASTGGRESGSAEDAAAATFAADTAVVDALDEHASAAGGLLMASVAYLMDLVPALGDAAQCRLLRDTVEVLVGEMLVVGTGTVFYQGSMARVMGELNLGAGEPAVAIPRFEEGIRVDGRWRPATWHARPSWPGQLRAADTLLTEVTAKARAADPLTPREREIVELVAQALPNREIARQLVLSEHTVESHVSRILAKTGHTSRTELTRWFLSGGTPSTGSAST